jgi:hypothetical protein
MNMANFDEIFAPFDEMLSEEEFTNRQKELKFLWSLAEQASQHRAPSYAIIARKGMGKTALMLEFYRQLFTQQRKVVPFFVSFAEERAKPGAVQLTLEKFISKLFVTFAFQYGAFKRGKYALPLELPKLPSEQKEFFATCGDAYLEKQFLGHLEALETGAIENAFDHAIEFASTITSRRGEAGLVMIDEFQVLTQIYDQRYGKFRDITGHFQKVANANWCPILVCGSEENVIIEAVMGGLSSSRFGPFFLEPFDFQHTLEYAYKLSRKQKIKISEVAAAVVHYLTGGNPYYIKCFFSSLGLKEKDLSTFDKVKDVYTFEITDRQGKLRQFWDTHFNAFSDKINSDKIGLMALYQLAVAKQEVRGEEIAAALQVEPEKVYRVLKNLEQADLIEWQSGAFYHHITDPILAAYIEREYQTKIVGKHPEVFIQEQLHKLRQQRGKVVQLLGKAAELYTRHVLLSFADQEVDALAVFNLELGTLRLPKFSKVEHRTGLVIEGETIEFDLVAEGEERWLVEVKYRKEPVRHAEVEKFVEKLQKTEGWQPPLGEGKRLWFFSQNGFDDRAAARLRELNILHNDIGGFNALCRAVKIGEVPVE